MDFRRLLNLCVTNLSIIVALSIATLPALPQGSGTPPHPRLRDTLDKILSDADVQTGFQGIVIESLADHRVLYDRNADQVFLPASNNKLLTSCAALEILGLHYAFHTRIYCTGALSPDGTLSGDLVLAGSGDPVLAPADLAVLASEIRRAGIERITGHVCYDDSRFDRQWLGVNWAWDDEPYAYSAQVSALNINENVIDVLVTPGRRMGKRVVVSTKPQNSFARIINRATTSATGTGPMLFVTRTRGTNTVTVDGSLPADDVTGIHSGVTLDNPARFAACLMFDQLVRTGVRIDHSDVQERVAVPGNSWMVCEHLSPSLSDLLPKLNKPSNNLIAECLLKAIGAERSGTGTSGAGGTGPKAARIAFEQMGLDMGRLQQVDGSGLSRTNFVSPRNLVRLLSYAGTTPYFQILYDSLPIAGVDGTLANRMKGTSAAANCHAKTGTLSNVSSLSGYVRSADGEMLVFAILMNNHIAGNRACTAVQDRIVTLLANLNTLDTIR